MGKFLQTSWRGFRVIMKILVFCLFGVLLQFCSALKDGSVCETLEHFKGKKDWRRVKEGNVTQLVAYGDYMFAIGTDKAVYKFNTWQGGDWIQVAPGNVSSISVNDDYLYGVLEDGAVYTCEKRRCSKWKKIADGSVTKIVARDEYVFVIKPDMEDNAVWQTTWDGYWPYRRVTVGTTLDLAFTRKYMYGLGNEGAVWKSPKDGSWPWKQITTPHNITQIDASQNYIYGVSRDGGAWRTKFGNTPWTKIGGDQKVRHLAVQYTDCGADVYAVGEDHGLWKLR